MQSLDVSGAVRLMYRSLGVKGLISFVICNLCISCPPVRVHL